MSESINERIRAIRKYYCNDSNIEFANKLNISRQAANNYAREGYIVGRSVIDNITDAFPDVNASWIFTGEGYMLKSAETQMVDRLMLLIQKIERETPFLNRLDYEKEELKVILEKDILTRNEIIGDLNEINPNININWILTGRGSMFIDKSNNYADFIDRVKELINILHETQTSFLKRIGCSIDSIDSIQGGNDVNELIRCIAKAYPNINSEWLFFGEGEIFKEDGITIKYLREKLGYSISEISNYLGVQEHYYEMLENGEIPLEDNYRELLAEKYQVDELGLISEKDYISPKSKKLTEDPSSKKRLHSESKKTEQSKDASTIIDNKQETRPRIPLNAAAGSVSVALSGVKSDDCEHLPFIPAFSNYNYTILVKGDSMEPEFKSGDELACLQLTNGKAKFIQWGRYHVLDTAQGIVVKRIYDSGDYILCKSENKELYPDFQILKEDIYNIGLVIGMLRRF